MPHSVRYARAGKRYFKFKSSEARDAWVAAAPEDERREALNACDVPTRLKFHGSDLATGETLEPGPELPGDRER